MSGITLDQLLFDTSAIADGPSVGAYLLSSSGELIDSTGNDLHVLIQNASLVVTATDLDIRDLVNTQDSIAIGDETNLIDLQQMDAAFGLTSFGFGIYGVRQDAGGSPVSADGDAHPLVFNNDGELKVAADLSSSVADDDADSGNPVKIGGRGVDGLLTALSASNDRFDLLGDMYRRVWVNDSPNVGFQVTDDDVTTTAAEILATPLNGRRRIIVQNRGDKSIFIGHTVGVTSATGIEIPKKASMELPFGEDLDIFAVADSGSQDVRLLEVA